MRRYRGLGGVREEKRARRMMTPSYVRHSHTNPCFQTSRQLPNDICEIVSKSRVIGMPAGFLKPALGRRKKPHKPSETREHGIVGRGQAKGKSAENSNAHNNTYMRKIAADKQFRGATQPFFTG